MIQSLFLHVLDFLFPPTSEALKLRALSAQEIEVLLPKATTGNLPFISSLFTYKDPLVSELIASIKNKKDRHAFRCAGFALYKKISENLGHFILIPIPLSKRRARERGYNQCEMLIDEVLKLDTEKRFEKRTDILLRAKHTSEQKLKNREERLAGTEKIFKVVGVETASPVIIIDDVTTTGSTLKEARDALLQAGFTDVQALTVAH